jgi:hypothetical protein
MAMRWAGVAAVVFALALPAPAQAQQRPTTPRPFVERGFIGITAGVQASPEELSERVLFERHAETGTIQSDHPGRIGVLAGVTAGMKVGGRVGAAIGVSQARRSAEARITAEIPHPFFDVQPRTVAGTAPGISRIETAIHGQLYYDMQPRGAWRVRLFAGPSYLHVDQETVTDVEVEEVYPFDTAEFRAAVTGRARGSAVGVNAGVDVARMFTRRLGVSGLVRYTVARIDLDAPGSRSVSTDAGGLHAGLGLRILF